MVELRLVDSSAPAVSMPRAVTAWSTVVAVVQIVCGLPSTLKVTSRPNLTAIRDAFVELRGQTGGDDVVVGDLDALALQQVADRGGPGAYLIGLAVDGQRDGLVHRGVAERAARQGEGRGSGDDNGNDLAQQVSQGGPVGATGLSGWQGKQQRQPVVSRNHNGRPDTRQNDWTGYQRL